MPELTLQSLKEQRLANNKARKKLLNEMHEGEDPSEAHRELLESIKHRDTILADQMKFMEELKNVDHELEEEGDEIPTATAHFATAKKPDDGKYGYTTIHQFLTDMVKSADESKVTERLMNYQVALKNAIGSDEHSVSADPYGGFLAPPGFKPELLKVDNESDPTAAGGIAPVFSIPIESASLKIPARVDKVHTTSVTGGLTVSRRAETGAGTSSRMEVEQVELEPKSLFGIAFASERILRHSMISLTAILQQGMTEEFQSEIFKEKISGTGAGEMEGILNSPCAISVARTGGGNSIEGADIISIRKRMWKYNRCIWLTNHDSLGDLEIAHRAGTNSDSMYFRAGSVIPGIGENASVDVPDTLLGRPIIFTEYVPALASAGDLLCWDPSQYLFGTDVTVGAQGSAESIHVRFENHERTFKFFQENDGRMWWRSPLTPVNGANTLSPVVFLAA